MWEVTVAAVFRVGARFVGARLVARSVRLWVRLSTRGWMSKSPSWGRTASKRDILGN